MTMLIFELPVNFVCMYYLYIQLAYYLCVRAFEEFNLVDNEAPDNKLINWH